MTDREIFKRNLIAMMNLTKTKQIDIANSLNVSYQTVSAWVKGRGYPRADAMEKLCRFFGVKQSVLTELHDETKSDEQILIDAFRSLSADGQEKLLERASELKKLYPKRGKKNAQEEESIH